jgi:tyrosyl-DNA phosphodiesterase-1
MELLVNKNKMEKRKVKVIEISSDEEPIKKNRCSIARSILPDGSLIGLSSILNDHNDDAISLRDLLNGNWTQIIQMNYMIDIEWFVSMLPERLRDIPMLFIHGSEIDGSFVSQHPNITAVKAALPFRFGTHHSKLMFLFDDSNYTMKFVLHTGNLISRDWK